MDEFRGTGSQPRPVVYDPTELLLDIEHLEHSPDTEDVALAFSLEPDSDILELDQELITHAVPPQLPPVDDPCIKVTVAPARNATKSTRMGENVVSAGFANGALSLQLIEARNLAELAGLVENRSHEALYIAVGSAYDFALAAASAPDELAQLLHHATIQPSKMMTTIVKLVFGFDYDKTRVAEYAAVLSHALRLDLKRGSLSRWLSEAPGGLKGTVAAERRIRRMEGEVTQPARTALRASVARQLRQIRARDFNSLAAEGDEFLLIVARREPDGRMAVLGEVPHNVYLLEKAASQLVRQSA